MPLLATSEWPPVYYAVHIIEYGYWVCNKKKDQAGRKSQNPWRKGAHSAGG